MQLGPPNALFHHHRQGLYPIIKILKNFFMTDGRKENCVAESEHFEGSCIYISRHCRVSIFC